MSLVETLLVESKSSEDPGETPTGWLMVSPYIERPHLLKLQSTAVPQQLLAEALMVLRPTREDYATASYQDSFNWGEVVQTLKDLLSTSDYIWVKRSFYIVAFRSQILTATDRLHLGALDKRAHAEAMKSGGLLKYWFGTPNSDGRNLATCKRVLLEESDLAADKPGVWDKREDATRAGGGEGHREAAKKTANLYSEWRIERLRFEIEDNAEQWSIQEWE